jgi:mannose-6-phosphate isomerase
MEPLIFQPLYVERVWGGQSLGTLLKRTLPKDKRIGESWELVDRTDAQSIIAKGSLKGKTLRSLMLLEREAIMGPRFPENKPFPILVKWLDCQERLSLQVHPPAAIAKQLGGEPKTENWYFLSTKSDAAVLAGFSSKTEKTACTEAIREGTLEALVRRIPVDAGDSIFIPSGRIHAIDAGNIILEIQQNSDTTYRVYDWGRVGLDGQPRTLHIPESIASIDFSDTDIELHKSTNPNPILADCAHFRIRRLEMNAGESISFEAHQEPRLLHIVRGTFTDKFSNFGKLHTGTNVLLPYANASTWQALEPSTLLITDQFSSGE